MLVSTVENRRTLSSVQTSLLVVVGLLVIIVESLTIQTFFSSTKTAKDFEEASFLTTDLANIQREALIIDGLNCQ